MDKIEIDEIDEEIKVAENQIAFDLDNIPDEVEEEESSVLPEQAFSKQDFEWVKKELLLVVVRNRDGAKVGHYDTYICGRPMIDWVVMAGGGCESRVINDQDNIIDTLKNIKTDKPYMMVLYSDTPLMNKEVVYKVIDYFVRNRLNAMTLLRGYCFRVDFLQDIDKFSSSVLEKFDERAFMRVTDAQSFTFANNKIRDKILDFHEQNGVTITERAFVVIDADVEIESGVIVKRGNVLKGQTSIGKDCVLQEGNCIVNSIIGERCNLLNCRVYESTIGPAQTLECKDFLMQNVFGLVDNNN